MAVRTVPIRIQLEQLSAYVRNPGVDLEGPMPLPEAIQRCADLSRKGAKIGGWKPLVIIDPKDAEEFGR